MAYDVYGVRFLLHAADLGVDYTSTATLGHLFLFAGQADVAEALAACRGVKAPEVAASVYRDCAGYVDGILRYLGANHVDSIDASDYEDATVVHDFNAQFLMSWRSDTRPWWREGRLSTFSMSQLPFATRC